MADIFDGISGMSDDELRLQLALFENATITSVVKETGYRFVGGIRDFANAFSGVLGNRTQYEYDVKKVSDMVADSLALLRLKNRDALVEMLKQTVIKLAKELSGEQIEQDISRERLNKIIVDEAAKTFSIEKYETIANKTEQIIIEYNNAFLKTLHSRLVKENAEQKRITDTLIQNRMNEVSMDTKRQLHQRVMPKEFNGAGIGRVLRSESGTKYLTEVLTFLGKGALDCTSAEVWTILMAMKGLKRPSRMQLARFIWNAGEKTGGKFAFNKDILPGYIAADKSSKFNEDEKVFRNLLQEKNNIYKKLEQSTRNLEKQRMQQDKDSVRLNDSMERYDNVKLKFTELDSKKTDYYEGHKSEAENKSFYASVNETKRSLDQAEAEYERLKNRLYEQEKKTDEAQKEYEALSREYEVVAQMAQDAVNERVKQLQILWKAYFYKFGFNDEAFSYVVTQLTREEQLNVESKLKELHDAASPYNYRDEENEEKSRFFCHVSSGKNVVIEMAGSTVVNISKKE